MRKFLGQEQINNNKKIEFLAVSQTFVLEKEVQ